MTKQVFRAEHIAAIVMGVALCLAFTSAVQAEETSDNTGAAMSQSEKYAQLKSLQEKVKAMRESMQGVRTENRAMIDELKEERKEENKAVRVESREAFMAEIANLSGEERRAAIMAYVSELRAQVEARKAEMQANRAAYKETKVADREEFQASLEGLSLPEKLAAIQARLAAIRANAEERNEKLSDALDDDAEDGEVEDESEDESDEDSEDESDDEEDEEGEDEESNDDESEEEQS